MGKKKVFEKVDLAVPMVEFVRTAEGLVQVAAKNLCPEFTLVQFPPNPYGRRSFDFAPFYGQGCDEVVYACQTQIERFLAKQDADVEASTVVANCKQGLPNFFRCLSLRSIAQGAPIQLRHINRGVIDDYLSFLHDAGLATTGQKNTYSRTKAVLKALCRRGLIQEVLGGDTRTFPENPFPASNKKHKGAKRLTLRERTAVTVALRAAIAPLLEEGAIFTSFLLSYALLIIALHTGRNTTPLLELERDCLRSHPKSNARFLVLYKRRGNNSDRVALQGEAASERATNSTSTLRTNVVRLVEIVIAESEKLRPYAPDHFRNRIWLYRVGAKDAEATGRVTALDDAQISSSIRKLVFEHHLVDSDNKPLKLNISRLRKTFINRLYEILDGDTLSTSRAAGNTVSVVETSYLSPGEDAEKDWRFMGQFLFDELLTSSVGASERTPVGGCSDTESGEYAPKRVGALCMSFLNCLRCRNYVVTADDLYRLFSFYWRLLKERNTMEKRRWNRKFKHIVRLIDRDIVAHGLSTKIFTAEQVDTARSRALMDPHPFWKADGIMDNLEGMA